MSILNFIGGLFTPLTALLDEVIVDDEERGKLKNELAKIQSDAQSKIIELEKSRMEALSRIQVADSNSSHFLAANWRPMCSIAIVGLIIGSSFGLCTITPEIYELASVFLGAYAGGRSFEKIANVVKLGGK